MFGCRLFAIPLLASGAGAWLAIHPAGDARAAEPIANCTAYSGIPAEQGDKAGMAFVPGGSFTMGSDHERPEERFSHVVRVDGFWIDEHEVTNAQFAEFVRRPVTSRWPSGVSIPRRIRI